MADAPGPPRSADPKLRVTNPDLEIKDAQIIFGQAWRRLEAELGREKLIFPKEIMWLGGAPGAGKGTNTPFIMRERGLTAPPVVMSDLLDAPQMRVLKDQGKLVGDREVVEVLLRELLRPIYASGVVVDGFPRTRVQAEAVKMLHDRMLELRRESLGTPHAGLFNWPFFRITVLFVDEKTSIERQLHRGRAIESNNERVRHTGVGELIELRPTDIDETLARNRYRTFKEQTYDALTSLRTHFHYHFINAEPPLAEVEKNIIAEFQYQSSLELGHDTHDIIHRIPLASEVILHARQELVRRLDDYEQRDAALFRRVIAALEAEVIPAIRRHVFAGKVHVKTGNTLFEEPLAVEMAMDTLSERGYRVMYEREAVPVPERIESSTGRVVYSDRTLHAFEIWFTPPDIRRGRPA